MTSFDHYIQHISEGYTLSEEEMQNAIGMMFQGDIPETQMSKFLSLLHERGESTEEITGAAKALRALASTIQAPEGALDCCGTGGDGAHTYNISTAVALVTAACGVPVAKHGNRASSSKCGAADVLEELGVNLDMPHSRLEQALKELNFCFLMAPKHHQAMKHVAKVRKEIGHRTIFNLLGPLANPAGTKFQLIGVFAPKWLKPLAQVLHNLGTKRAWLVHGHDGLDEITTTAPTTIVKLDNGNITQDIVTPDEFGLEIAQANELKGGDASTNAAALLAILKHGKKNAYRDIVLANSAAALNIHGRARTLKDGTEQAAKAIDSGKAFDLLEKYIEFTNE
ncbi:MAG: anthranilate phosphoribosyltransferase [Alphaproteobacteria bacterium]|nr:anthranilate phosphoribosyltransferase [Alphaproteobacteria bacterium]